MNRLLLFTAALLLLFTSLYSQVTLNAYAKVTAVTGSSILTLSNVNETNHTFTVGGNVIVMQMQDDVIGTNTTNATTFGNIGSISNAGNFEVMSILSRTPAVGTPTAVTLSGALANTYNTGANSSVQLITFRNLGANYTTSANITGLTWDGNVGGVIAIEVTNTLTLQHSISANQIGFRLGSRSNSAGGGCNAGTYISSTTSEGAKGEGIYKITNSGFTRARGKVANGGGAGNEHNAGGAGGGNYSAGGDGGPGYGCSPSAGGLGGLALSTYISGSRVFMGGGGGGGGQNNGYNSDGANGGGIILLKANTLATNSTCGSPIGITANGGSAANVGNDGAGGGGAAGTIVLNVSTFSITSTCTLAVNANGGGGGSVTDGTQHAGGGGGGQGAVLYSTAQPTTNMQTTTLNGAGGQNNSGGTYAGSGSGSGNAGILPLMLSPLPIDLLNFTAEPLDGQAVRISWATASEKNNSYFILERSTNGETFTELARKPGGGTSKNKLVYEHEDSTPLYGISYYRLSQVDRDGKAKTYPPVAVQVSLPEELQIYPNPVSHEGELVLRTHGATSLSLFDTRGVEVAAIDLPERMPVVKLQLRDLSLQAGVYFLRLTGSGAPSVKRLLLQ